LPLLHGINREVKKAAERAKKKKTEEEEKHTGSTGGK
jgi:hypothetical protein